MLMLFKLDEISKYIKGNVNGVFHVGAHHGQELETYKKLEIKNIIFFEPMTESYVKLYDMVSKNDNQELNIRTENIALGHRECEKMMYVETANQGQSCSILKPKEHLKLYPTITFDSTTEVSQTFLDKYVEENGIEEGTFNFINIDVQGYELEVFKGAMNTLNHIDYIYTEVNTVEVYENCAKMNELDDFLGDIYGFKRVLTKLTKDDTWGDALYVKE